MSSLTRSRRGWSHVWEHAHPLVKLSAVAYV